jgi:isopenicillin-N epimerase
MKNELFMLDPSVIFLNHGSFGACPRPVFDKYQDWQRQLEHQPVKFLGRDLNEHLQASREALAEEINCNPRDLVLIPNATYGVNIATRCLPIKSGDEILTTDHEYGACLNALEFACHKRGAKLITRHLGFPVEPLSRNDLEDNLVEQLWQAVTSRTRLIFLSHITSPTALILPVEKICQRARQAGIMTLIDGAHAPGQISLNIETIGADIYTGNCHKWFLAPKGSGFLFVRQEMQHWIEPLVVSWGWGSNKTISMQSRFLETFQWTGTQDLSAVLTIPAAIEFRRKYHWNDVIQECHRLLDQALIDISELMQIPSPYQSCRECFVQMAVAPLPVNTDSQQLKIKLYERFRIEIPCIEWGESKLIRISVQGYNSRSDIDELIDALITLIPANSHPPR